MVKKAIAITPGIEPLYGTRDENLHLLEAGLQVQIDIRSDAIHICGDETPVGRAAQVFADFDALRKAGVTLQNGELNALLKLVVADPRCTLRQLYDAGKQRSAGVKRAVQPRSANQKKYVEAIEAHDMTFGLGPAGTGKTYLAVAMAVSALMAKKVSRIILVRPAVEAGERLGFLPGSLQEKVDPYLRPLYDALYDLLDQEKVDKLLERNVIEVAPLAFMRGRTLSDAFIIMDEAQNTTMEQMKMFVTRLGNNSKAVITGDLTQTDLPNPKKSGLLDALQRPRSGVEGIKFCHFEDVDVVRHAPGPAHRSRLRLTTAAPSREPLLASEDARCSDAGPALSAVNQAARSQQAAVVHSAKMRLPSASGGPRLKTGAWPAVLLVGFISDDQHRPPKYVPTRRTPPPPASSGLTRFLNRARAAVGFSGDVDVLLTSDAELKRLNKAPSAARTSLPTSSAFPPPLPEPPSRPSVTPATSPSRSKPPARQAAEQFGHTLREEVRILLLHGLLHLSGLKTTRPTPARWPPASPPPAPRACPPHRPTPSPPRDKLIPPIALHPGPRRLSTSATSPKPSSGRSPPAELAR